MVKKRKLHTKKPSKAPPADDTKANLELLKLRMEIVKLGVETVKECLAITIRIAGICVLLHFVVGI